MTITNFDYLKLIPYSNFDLWDTKRYTSERISSNFDIVKLGNCIREENKKYKLFLEEEKEFGILGVNNKTGIFDAYVSKGREINQPYKKMEIGWIAYNPYRVNVGSIGVRTNENENEYISPAYVVFSCLNNVLPDYLYLLFKTGSFNNVINENTTGSVRQNLTIEILKNLEIPLPSVDKQEQIVDAYRKKNNQAKDLENQVKDLNQEIERYLFEELGIKQDVINYKASNKLLNTISYDKIDRWAIDYLSKYSKLNFLESSSYKLLKLKEVILSYQYGLSEKASKEDLGLPILRMNNILNSELILDNIKYLKDDSNFHKFILDEGDLLFNRTNSKELVGKTAIFNVKGKYTFASYLIRVKIDPTKANVGYINYLFNSTILQIQKDLVSRQITGQANINAQEMQDFIFPIPPLNIQNKICQKLDEIKNELNNKMSFSQTLKLEAKQELEQAIFNKI